MSHSNDRRISEATRYVEQLGWVLTFVRGVGSDPKAPLFLGWPDFRPDAKHVRTILEGNGDAQIGLNLGASSVIDVEADTKDGEALLDGLCSGVDFPCWRSFRGKHRLFQAEESLAFLKIEGIGIEFRTGRHQSVLPPSVILGAQYEWLNDPFTISVPPLPKHLRDFYFEQEKNPANKREPVKRQPKQRWPYRDDRDYVLRHFDLQAEAEKVGLKFVVRRPDLNGNIPCYVPAALRDGNEDEHPSGVFNVRNGILRDFATGINHRFFRVMEALTDVQWQHIFSQFEAEAEAVSGRPHSRRISFPPQDSGDDDRKTLEEIRADLGVYFDQQLDREPQPKLLHVIKGPPGLGKTWAVCKKLAGRQKKAIILTLENKLARMHQELLQQGGNQAARMPVLRESICPHPDEYERTARRGFKPSQSFPCKKCVIGPASCPYLLGFRDLIDGDQLCAAAIYHTHDDFYSCHGNENRPLLVFDENCIDLLLEPVSHSVNQWQAWGQMVNQWDADHPLTKAFMHLVDWLKQIETKFLGAVDKNGIKVKFRPVPVSPEIKLSEISSIDRLTKWLDRNAYKENNRQVQNLTNAAIYLLTEPASFVLLERIAMKDGDLVVIRFRKKNPLPDNKEVFILDATANEELVRALAPGWEVRVWNCPPIEQAGHVIQIMDYDVSRKRIRREIAAHENHNPSWLVQVVDAILEKHGPAAVISFKDVIDATTPEMNLLAKLQHRGRITDLYNFPCRGHTFDDDTLIVIGTPYKDQASIWELALAIWGETGPPRSHYMHRGTENGCFVSKNMAYEEQHLKSLQDFVVSADLVQAIGRVRPLQRPTNVFVISNAPIFDWDFEQFMASELFDLRQPMRRDAANRYSLYTDAAKQLLKTGKWITNREVCERLSIPERTGSGYWKRLVDHLQKEIELGPGRMRKKPSTISL